ncbi:MAG: vitamin K epoxide reductase family protein [bacterium]
MKRMFWIIALGLCIGGIILTAFLTHAHVTGSIGSICTEGQGCGKVLTSPWSTFLGLPTALYGLIFYFALFMLFLVYPLGSTKGKSLLMNGAIGLTASGLLVSIVLVLYSVLAIGTTCFYCNTSFGLIATLFFGTIFWRIQDEQAGTFEGGSRGVWQAVAITFGVLLIVASGLGYYVYRTGALEAVTSQSKELPVLANGPRSLGDPNAPIRVVEFFDLACPACRQFTLNTFPKIKKQYIDTGKVLWTFRYFPIMRSHENSLYAHGVLELIPPTKFLQAKKTIQRNQKQWKSRYTSNPKPYFSTLLLKYGLSEGPSDPLLERIRRNQKFYGRNIGVSATPSFMINGKLYRGGLPFRRWKRIFNNILN